MSSSATVNQLCSHFIVVSDMLSILYANGALTARRVPGDKHGIFRTLVAYVKSAWQER